MVTHALHHYPARSELPRWVLVGVISGAVSVLVFHQGLAALLHALEVTAHATYSLQPTRPFGVPVLWSIVFWGGVWGAVLAATLGRLDWADGEWRLGPGDRNRARALRPIEDA